MADPAVEKPEELRHAPDATESRQQKEEEEEEEDEGEDEDEEDGVKEVEEDETDGSIAPPSLGLNSDELATPDKVAPSHQLLAAPQGWQKKITSTKKGKKDVCFVAPDGEEIKSKRTLDRYLKSHAGGPSSSEFDWSTGETPTRRSSRISSRTPPSFESPQRGSAKKRSSINALSSEGGSAQKRSRKKSSEKDEPEPSSEKDDVGATKDNEEILIARVTKEDEEIQGQVQVQDEKMEDVVEEELVKNVERDEIISKDESVVEEITIIKSEEVKINVSDDTRTSGDVKVEEVKDTGTEVVIEEVKGVELDTVINEESNKSSEDIKITSDEVLEEADEMKEGNIKENATIVTDEKTTIVEIQISSGTTNAEEVIAKSIDETKAAEELITKNDGVKLHQEEEEEEVSKTKSDEGKNGKQGSENEPNQSCPEAQKNLSMSSVHAVST